MCTPPSLEFHRSGGSVVLLTKARHRGWEESVLYVLVYLFCHIHLVSRVQSQRFQACPSLHLVFWVEHEPLAQEK